MKKAFALLSIVALTASLLVHPASGKAATAFTDVSTYKEEIGCLTNQNIIKGYPDGTFKPKYQLETYGKPDHMFYQHGKLLIFSTIQMEGSNVPYVGLETIEFETK